MHKKKIAIVCARDCRLFLLISQKNDLRQKSGFLRNGKNCVYFLKEIIDLTVL